MIDSFREEFVSAKKQMQADPLESLLRTLEYQVKPGLIL
jgi:hypothetical protein